MTRVVYSPNLILYPKTNHPNIIFGTEEKFVVYSDEHGFLTRARIYYGYDKQAQKLHIIDVFDELVEYDEGEALGWVVKAIEAQNDMVDKLWNEIVEGIYPPGQKTCLIKEHYAIARQNKINQFGTLCLKDL